MSEQMTATQQITAVSPSGSDASGNDKKKSDVDKSGKIRYEDLTGIQKVAIVLAQLKPDTSAKLMQAVGEEQAVMLATEMVRLPSLNRETVTRVLTEFVEKVNTTRSIGQGGISQAKQLLAAVVGEEKAREIMSQLQGKVAVGPLAFLSQADPKHVIPFLVDEHPQTVAVILAHMPPDDGSLLLDAMPADFRAEVALRIATMDKVSPEAISAAAQQLANKLKGVGSSVASAPGGIPTLVELLNRADGSTEKQVLAELDNRDPELAEAIRAKMLTFEDVMALDDKTLQSVLRKIQISELALAIKGTEANSEVSEKIKKNLSDRARTELAEEIEIMGQVRSSQVDSAQSSIVKAARELEAEGIITIARKNDEILT